MREIKFRVWSIEDKRFLTGYKEVTRSFFPSGGGYELQQKNEVWQQYTGMIDEDGKEIYEGDIIFCKVYYGIENRVGIVDYFASSFIVDWRNQIDDPLDEIPDIKVIGNIFENPELLK
jgi:uncharacterized phage protein (TIGR01671 family)